MESAVYFITQISHSIDGRLWFVFHASLKYVAVRQVQDVDVFQNQAISMGLKLIFNIFLMKRKE